MLNKLSIRMRLTILTGSIIVCTSLILTLTSIYNANNQFVLRPINSYSSQTSSAENIAATVVASSPIASEDSSTIPAATVTMNAQLAKRQFDLWSYVYLIFIAYFGMIAAYYVSGKALKPIHDLSKTLEKISANNLSEHISVVDQRDEVGSLTTSFNAMLDRLENAFSMQKRFSADAAHELKTPLATIKTSMEVLQLDETPTIDDYKENLEITQMSTDRLIKVVEGLLTLTSECSEDFSNQIELKSFFFQIMNELQPTYQDKRIRIDLDLGQEYVTGNQVLLYRAFFNLLENALKYNRKDGFVAITALREGTKTEISIRDSGIGIPVEERALIFEPFYRVDKSRSRLVGGSGLGLSIVKSIIERHKGEINVESELNEGTTFTVILSPLLF